jgi:hypothetical protein
MPVLTDAMAAALEELAKGWAVRAQRTGVRGVQFRTATRLVSAQLATYNLDRRELLITDAGREALEAHRAGWRG